MWKKLAQISEERDDADEEVMLEYVDSVCGVVVSALEKELSGGNYVFLSVVAARLEQREIRVKQVKKKVQRRLVTFR